MHSTLVKLQSFDLLSITGEDSKKFLQGQVSCNTDLLTSDYSLGGVLCNVKGRVIADFRLFEHQQVCYLQLGAGMAEKVKTVLDKYIVFSKAETEICHNRFARYGLIGNDAYAPLEQIFGSHPFDDGAAISKDGFVVMKIPGLIPRYEIWQDLKQNEDGDVISLLKDQAIVADVSAWKLEDIKSGIAHITPAVSEQYLPESLNFDISGLIDFKKGCYTGQEIVARMFYRGTAKKRLYHLYLDSGVSNQIGDANESNDNNKNNGTNESDNSTQNTAFNVTHLQQQEPVTDEVIAAVKTQSGQCHVLAILPVEAVDDDVDFYLNHQPASILQVQPLPYQQ